MKYMKTLVLALLLPALFCGCGYTTRGFITQSGYRTIYIEPFINQIDTTSEYSEGARFRTYFPLLENTITNAVVDRFNFNGSLRVARMDEADLVLTGFLINYRRETLRASSSDNPEEYRVTLFVNMTLKENKTGKVVWQKNEFAGDTTYFVTGSQAKSESQAVNDAAQDLARRIVETTVEAW